MDMGKGILCPDGAWVGREPLSDLLRRQGREGFERYFDDWYLYRVPEGTWGLYKMREQEHDGFDGDTPGMTVCFVKLDPEVFCLPSEELERELQGTVGGRDRRHSGALGAYFRQPEAVAPYVMGLLYIRKLASCAEDGLLALPDRFAHASRRLRRFVEPVLRDGRIPVTEEAALLAAHSGCTSLHGLAAEVRFHAAFLEPRLPGIYASAIRADMGMNSWELLPLMPYYSDRSRWVRAQRAAHPEPEKYALLL